MPDEWHVTEVTDSTDDSGQIDAWEITIARPADEVSVAVWLPKMAIEDTAVAHGLTSTDEAIDVILHQAVMPVYEPGEAGPNPWRMSGEQARAQVLGRVERCKATHATVAAAVPKGRAAARSAVDVLAPLRAYVRIDPVKVAAARLEQQRVLLTNGD